MSLLGELRDDISLDGDEDDAEAAAGASGPSPAFLPMLGGMMRNILSKEVLHPSLQGKGKRKKKKVEKVEKKKIFS